MQKKLLQKNAFIKKSNILLVYKEISDTKKSQVITEGEIIMTKNILKNKIDFVAFISVRGAIPNGDPNN